MKRPFAEGTVVPAERTRAEIETTLARYGAQGYAYAASGDRARVEFQAHNRRVRFDLRLPHPDEERFTRHPKRKWLLRPDAVARKAWEDEIRRLWRALLLAIKAKLEVVESGMAIFEEEFMANIVMPDNRTVAEHALPGIAAAYQTGKVLALLPASTHES